MKGERVILHLDANSYFASVEQQANPFLRGKSVGVVATKTIKGCIVASSKEAKAKGIKTGCRVEDAVLLDPSIVLIEYRNSHKYRSTTERLWRIIARHSDAIEPYSIDEAFLDLTGFVPSLEAGAALGARLQREIHDEVGEWITCSVGVAPTRWLAKFAGDTAPKGGVVTLRPPDLPRYLERFVLTDAWGINVRMERRLNALGIHTLNELRTFPVTNLLQALGKPGYYLWAAVNGVETSGLVLDHGPKSIGHQHILRRHDDPGLPRRVLAKLCERTGRRLRERGLEAHGLHVWVSFTGGGGFHRGERMRIPLFGTSSLFRAAEHLLGRTLLDHPVLGLGISAYHLLPRTHQLSLFHDPAREDAVTAAVDKVNTRFGEMVLYHGAMWETGRDAPDRVGFRKTVNLPTAGDVLSDLTVAGA